MRIFTISDLHLGSCVDKPMDVFGEGWEGHFERICEDWQAKVSDEDYVLLCGDLSWALKLEDAIPDINALSELKGTKIIIKGNHDLWWTSMAKVERILPRGVLALQHTAVNIGGYIVCGTRGWAFADENSEEHDKAMYRKELLRTEMAINAAKKLQTNGEKIILMQHYPPFGVRVFDTPYTQLIEESGVDTVVYGHLHGKSVRATPKIVHNGVRYILSSCDLVNNTMVELDQE